MDIANWSSAVTGSVVYYFSPKFIVYNVQLIKN